MICPGDNVIGTAYIVCLEGNDNVGPASNEDDRKKILGMVEKGPGHTALNNSVNNLLIKWIKETLQKKSVTTEREVVERWHGQQFVLYPTL